MPAIKSLGSFLIFEFRINMMASLIPNCTLRCEGGRR